MNAYLRVEPGDEAAYTANLKAITDHLTRTRSLPLGPDDLAGIDYVYGNFYKFGPGDQLHVVHQRTRGIGRQLRRDPVRGRPGHRRGTHLPFEREHVRAGQGTAEQESDRAGRR